MKIFRDISLSKYNTFDFDYRANCLILPKTEDEAISLFRGEISWEKPLLIMGSGSNILFTSDFKGTILCPEIGGIKIEEQDQENVLISAGAGVNWDNLVEWTVNKGFGGLENLSLIPGLVGATPVQNIGAYGVEVKDTIEKVRAVSIEDGSITEFNNNDCRFEYRNSIFKGEVKGKYLVTRVYYKLTVNPLLNLNYGSLKEEVNKLGSLTLKNVRRAVINIRRRKLPDPEVIGNAGSFFKNPVVSSSAAEIIKKSYPQMTAYEDQSWGIKLAAGWLIDQCGWKGKRIGDAGVHDKQALVLVNHGKATGKEIYDLSEAIKKSVREKFGVELEREVEVVGTI
ncbi:MAG: UDP-N-acetylmuramate dehydrogenase [Bacteroidales bacterium]|nr:UDP-N-acetylmuramate dehydrogenase [Bacteroidales bacterium]